LKPSNYTNKSTGQSVNSSDLVILGTECDSLRWIVRTHSMKFFANDAYINWFYWWVKTKKNLIMSYHLKTSLVHIIQKARYPVTIHHSSFSYSHYGWVNSSLDPEIVFSCVLCQINVKMWLNVFFGLSGLQERSRTSACGKVVNGVLQDLMS
jgi:hypothetical protein